MGPSLRRRLDRIEFWRMFRHPVWAHLHDLERQLRRLRGIELWAEHERKRSGQVMFWWEVG